MSANETRNVRRKKKKRHNLAKQTNKNIKNQIANLRVALEVLKKSPHFYEIHFSGVTHCPTHSCCWRFNDFSCQTSACAALKGRARVSKMSKLASVLWDQQQQHTGELPTMLCARGHRVHSREGHLNPKWIPKVPSQ